MTNRRRTKARRAAGTPTSQQSSGRQQMSTGRPYRSQGRDRVAEHAEQETQQLRRTRARILVAVGLVAIVLAGVLVAVVGSSSGTVRSAQPSGGTLSGPPGPEGVPLEEGSLLAPAPTAATGQPVDGVQCNSTEQVAYHVHTHVSVYVNGQLRPIPAGIGIVQPLAQQTANGPFDGASQCYYWLHVHAQDGVVHIESPAGHTYTLGTFFDLWGQRLGADQVGPAVGRVTLFVNGQPYRGNPRDIRLGSHEDIQIDVGAPVVPPKKVDWSVTSL